MPDAPSLFDDPFADLFGKLPDPRERRSVGDDAARGTSTPDAPREAEGPVTRSAPMSRREAREAAAREARASTATSGSDEDTSAPAPVTSTPATTRSPAAAPVPAPTAPVEALDDDSDESWLFGGGGSGPSYARSGATTSARPAGPRPPTASASCRLRRTGAGAASRL